jgi:hypothetical protein
LEKGIRRRRLNLENTVEDMWELGTINIGRRRMSLETGNVGRAWNREGEVMRRAILE